MIDVNVNVGSPLLMTLEGLIESVAANLATTVESQSSKDVHDLRIATRRALAGIEMLQRVLPLAERKWFEKKLHQIRRSAGGVRDLDVMIERYAKHRRLAGKLTKRRANSFGRIQDVHQRLIEEGRFARHQRRLIDPLLRPTEAETLIDKDLCLESFNVIAGEFLAAARPMSLKTKKLHRLRKRGKHLRYALDSTSDFLPEELVQRFEETSKSLQSRLGEINDHDMAIQCISSLKKKTKGKQARRELRRLRNDERTLLKVAKLQLETWWTPKLVDDLELALRPAQKRIEGKVESGGRPASGLTQCEGNATPNGVDLS